MSKQNNNEDIARKIGKIYSSIINLRKDDDYVINQPQMEKFVELVEFFDYLANTNNGRLEKIILKPKEEHGDLTAIFLALDIWGEDIQKFSKVLSYTSAFGLDSRGDDGEVYLYMTVPNVFIKKS